MRRGSSTPKCVCFSASASFPSWVSAMPRSTMTLSLQTAVFGIAGEIGRERRRCFGGHPVRRRRFFVVSKSILNERNAVGGGGGSLTGGFIVAFLFREFSVVSQCMGEEFSLIRRNLCLRGE